MLDAEKNSWYAVYPPGVEFSYRWEDLEHVISNVIEILSLDPNLARLDEVRNGGPESFKPCQFFDGPVGGGIIHVELEPSEKKKWLPALLLAKEADLLLPRAMLG